MDWTELLAPGVLLVLALAAWRWLPTKADLAKLAAEMADMRRDLHALDTRLAVVEYAVGVTRPAPPPVVEHPAQREPPPAAAPR